MKLFKVRLECMVVAESESDICYFEIDPDYCNKKATEVKNEREVLENWLDTIPFGEQEEEKFCRGILDDE